MAGLRVKARAVIVPVTAIGPRDVIVVECPDHLAVAERDALTREVKRLWPKRRVLVLTDGRTLKIGSLTRS
jgi:hypothetical protein